MVHSSRRRGVTDLLERTGADELIVVSDVYDFAKRLRSFALIREATAALPGHAHVAGVPEHR